MHVVHNIITSQDDDQILRCKADGLLLHLLRNPDAGIFSHTYATFNDAYVHLHQIFDMFNGIRIQVGLDAWKIACQHLCLRIGLANELIQIVALFHLYELGPSRCGGLLDEFGHRIRKRNGIQSTQVRKVVGFTRVLPQPFQYFFSCTHSSSSFHNSWNDFLGNVII